MAWRGEVEDGDGWGGLVPGKAERDQERREAAEKQANTYARTLAIGLHKKHYPDVVWHPLPDTLGLLTQIDNMVAGLVKPSGAGS